MTSYSKAMTDPPKTGQIDGTGRWCGPCGCHHAVLFRCEHYPDSVKLDIDRALAVFADLDDAGES